MHIQEHRRLIRTVYDINHFPFPFYLTHKQRGIILDIEFQSGFIYMGA